MPDNFAIEISKFKATPMMNMHKKVLELLLPSMDAKWSHQYEWIVLKDRLR